MADVTTLNIEANGYRNVIIRATCVSDGTARTITAYDATSGGVFGVTAPGGQIVYPGVHTSLVKLDYDVQDMKLRAQWDATSPVDILALGAAPEDFDWTSFGGIRVPAGLTGATGSILLTTVDPLVGATYSVILYLRKNVPQS